MSETQVVSRDWRPGEVLVGKYRIIECIGVGGMGAVHAARRLSLDDVVAIKSILPQRTNPRNRARFLREAKALARISHPNVVNVFDFGEAEDGRPYMVMEYVEGPTLSRVLAAGRLPLERTLELFAEVCKAVEAGHRRGVIHRDLKPGNVMLARSDDGGEVVKVLDFGLASLLEAEDDPTRSDGALVGTYGYMSPESIEHRAWGPASDIFALGVMLYELVTGAQPFKGANPIATVMKICEGEYQPPQERAPGLPEAVSQAIAAALRREPEARPGSALELAALAMGRSLQLPARTEVAGGLRAPVEGTGATTSQGSSVLGESSGAGSAVVPAPIVAGDDATQVVDDPTVLVEEDESVRVHAALTVAPFVARKLELETLSELLTAALAGEEVPIAVVLGEAGLGRTRLLRRFAELARDDARGPVAVFEARFWGEGDQVAPALETFTRMLGGLLGSDAAPVDPGVDARSGFAELARRLEQGAAGSGRALVLVLDDIHRAASRDLEFLTYLVRGDRRALPVLVVASARSEAARSDARTELSRWLLQLAGLRARTSLTLAPFDEDELRAWLDAAFGRLRIHPRDLRRLRRACGGNPYQLTEFLRHLIASDRIRRDGSGGAGDSPIWVCARLDDDVMPEGLAAAVADQLATLEGPLLRMLEVAAVIGEQLGFDVLARALGPKLEIEDLVDDAVARGLLLEIDDDPIGSEFGFRSAVVQRVLYERLGTRRRRRLHADVIKALLGLPEPERQAQVLAGHYRAIGEWTQTLRWGLRAAYEAVARHDHDSAERALEHAQAAVDALERVGDRPSNLARLHLDALVGVVDSRVGRFAEGLPRLRAAMQALDRPLRGAVDDDGLPSPAELRFAVALAMGRCHVGMGELVPAAEAGRRALALALGVAQVAGQDPLAAEWEARVALAHALARVGDWPSAVAVLDVVVEAEAPPRLRVLHAQALRERGWIAVRSGAQAEAEVLARRIVAEARACAEPLAEYCADSLQAVVCTGRGATDEAIAHYRAALRRARALSLRRREMIEQANLSLALVDRGGGPALDEALQAMLAVNAICRELGDAASAADARVGLGRILRARGNLDEAAASFRRGFEACEAVGRLEYAAIALLEIGRCELARRSWSAAREALQPARERLTTMGSLHQWEAELALAEAARGLGDEAEAQRLASAAEALLEARQAAADGGGERVERGLAQVRAFKGC